MRKLFAVLLLVLLFAGCKKADRTPINPIDQLPAATHTGANTLGCLIDGKPFAAYGKPSFLNEQGVSFQPAINTAWYIAGKVAYQHLIMNINYDSSISLPAIFEMSDNYPAGAELLNPTGGSSLITGNSDFKTDSVHKGTLTLQYYDGKIAAG
ncbi:MAG: hypothetical protein ABI378_14835, partial [Chitinophagaceae bacterium]